MSTDIAGEASGEPIDWQPEETTTRTVVRRISSALSRLVQFLSFVVLLVLLIFFWRFFASRAEKAPAQQRNQAVPVEVAAATQRDVPIQIKGIGNVEALSTISV